MIDDDDDIQDYVVNTQKPTHQELLSKDQIISKLMTEIAVLTELVRVLSDRVSEMEKNT
jgi:hypothetical protein